jgi:hypothetical protein
VVGLSSCLLLAVWMCCLINWCNLARVMNSWHELTVCYCNLLLLAGTC